jgi:hypothetical protein
MRPAIVLPFHDPNGILLSHVERVEADLKRKFDRAFLSISPVTANYQAERLELLAQDPFFILNENLPDTLPGDHYRAAYLNAVRHCPPHQQLHLCDIDRVAFALQSPHRAEFLQSLEWVTGESQPVLFQRSPAAWITHPKPYREAEAIAIQLGHLLFGHYYDFAWSYLVVSAGVLAAILPTFVHRDFGLLAEIVLALRTTLLTREVNWLAWEDPFILGCDVDKLRAERESDSAETRKRLLWNAPIIRLLLTVIEPS